MKFLDHITLLSPTQLQAGERVYACQIGRDGMVSASEKREGDGRTPQGIYSLRACYFHPNHIPLPPKTGLPLIPLSWNDVWCDDPKHPAYNTPVKLPFRAGYEALWRVDHAYDLIIPIGYNDAPPIPGLGSAIFLHITHDDRRPTAGCIALDKHDLLELLAQVDDDTRIEIR